MTGLIAVLLVVACGLLALIWRELARLRAGEHILFPWQRRGRRQRRRKL
jgi:hypothetical protein